MKKIILIFAFFSVLHFSYAQWYLENNIPAQTYLRSVYFVDANHGWAVGNKILYYHDGSWTIQYQNNNYYLNSVHFEDENHGWAVGYGFNLDRGIILFYNGSSWVAQDSIAGESLNSVQFLDSLNGWVAGSNGTLLHYDGNSWVNDNSFQGGNLSSLFFLDNIHRWLVSNSYYWTGQYSQPYSNICGYDGNSWVYYGPGYIGCFTNTVSAVFMNNISEGWAIGNKCFNDYTFTSKTRFLKYNGTNWNEDYSIDLPGDDIPTSLFFTTSSNGWAAANGGMLLHYNGSSWSVVQTPSTQNLNSIFFINDNDGWAVGDNGTILYTHNGGVYLGIEQETTEESQFTILPNPTNDNITIERTELYNTADDLISIYTIQGQELIQQKAISKKSIIDIGSFCPGIYFVKVKTEKEFAVKKFIKR
jgi:photosystem II stability/assembly factor-like uncharacterized protein